MTITVVPQQDPGQSVIDLPRIANPFWSLWWTPQTVTGIPQESVGWLTSQGWRVTGVLQDQTTIPPTLTYTLTRSELQSVEVLLSLCNSYTIAANEARDANETRYNEVVANWTEMISSSQTQFAEQVSQQNAAYGVYLTDLGAYIDEINQLTDDNRQRLTLEYAIHKDAAGGYLTGLGSTELARINEEFAAAKAEQLQDAINRGFYSSLIPVAIKERNTRDRDEQIQMLNDRLMREKLQNEHQLWEQFVNLSEGQQKLILDKMNANVMRLEGWKNVHVDNMRLLAYQLDERNKLLIGLYSFVERREDIGPEWKDMTSMIAGLADQAGGWLTPN